MANLGEEICGEYLKYIKNCEFITYNVTNPDIQGEIDVVGINLESKLIYVCEVAIHTTGLQYVTNSRPDDYNRFVAKFDKDITYAQKYFKNYTVIPMIWSPVVRISRETAKYNTLAELKRVADYLSSKFGLTLNLIINEEFYNAMKALKEYTDTETAEFKSHVMRMFQIERSLDRHLLRLKNKVNYRRAKGARLTSA